MKDEWSGLANLLAELILKYADKINIDNTKSVHLENNNIANENSCCSIDKKSAA